MRKLSSIIIHCTATLPLQRVTVEDIRRWHKQRGFADIGYHYVIDRDGTIYQGRPIEQAGAHCCGHNEHSIGIAYVGGLNEDGAPADTRTMSQCGSLWSLCHALRVVFPSISEIHGHNEFSAKSCPCFDVQHSNLTSIF